MKRAKGAGVVTTETSFFWVTLPEGRVTQVALAQNYGMTALGKALARQAHSQDIDSIAIVTADNKPESMQIPWAIRSQLKSVRVTGVPQAQALVRWHYWKNGLPMPTEEVGVVVIRDNPKGGGFTNCYVVKNNRTLNYEGTFPLPELRGVELLSTQPGRVADQVAEYWHHVGHGTFSRLFLHMRTPYTPEFANNLNRLIEHRGLSSTILLPAHALIGGAQLIAADQ